MVARDVQIPMYQARIPIGGGGGVMDLSSKENETKMLLAQAIGEALGNISRGKREQPEDMAGQIVTEGGKTWLVDRKTGKKIDLGIKASPKVQELLKLIDVGRKYETPTETEKAISGSAEEELLGLRGFEKYEEEVPFKDVQWPWRNIPAHKETRIRKKVESREVPTTPITEALEQTQRPGPVFRTTPRDIRPEKGRVKAKTKERPPKPKEYPDAKWSEEHQMWTIVKNGRLMGVK